jgi:hypothetical protein
LYEKYVYIGDEKTPCPNSYRKYICVYSIKSDIYVEIASNLTWLEANQRISHDPLPSQRVVADVNEKVTVGPSLVLASDLTITTRALVHNESSTASNVPAIQGISNHSTKYSVG